MTNHNQHSDYAQGLRASLCDEKLPLIDFDRLKAWLTEVAPLFDNVHRLQQELAVLRQDYVARIGGMTKAVAAVNRHPAEWEAAVARIEELPSLTAGELVDEYRKTSARFRDAFPTSFAPAPDRKRGAAAVRDKHVAK
ncbi:MAG: hypothetical protein AB1744_06095 [Candidatus Zixiibacteriota bacterium]